MPKNQAPEITVTVTLKSCDQCPHYVDEDIDVGHGCTHIPAYCSKARRSIYSKDYAPDSKFPAWCPLLSREPKK